MTRVLSVPGLHAFQSSAAFLQTQVNDAQTSLARLLLGDRRRQRETNELCQWAPVLWRPESSLTWGGGAPVIWSPSGGFKSGPPWFASMIFHRLFQPPKQLNTEQKAEVGTTFCGARHHCAGGDGFQRGPGWDQRAQ